MQVAKLRMECQRCEERKKEKTRVGEKENSTCMREQSLLLLVMVAVEILRHQA